MNYSETDLQALAARVERLEASTRRCKTACGVLLLSGISLLFMGAKPADHSDAPVIRAHTVEAQAFLLKDADGHVYARLSLSPDLRALASNLPPNLHVFALPDRDMPQGSAVLQFFDEDGSVVWSAPTKPGLLPVK